MARESSKAFTIAAVQASPVFLDREKTVAKACKLIAEAAKQGARLIVFPEAFVPTYPDWVWALPPAEMGQANALTLSCWRTRSTSRATPRRSSVRRLARRRRSSPSA